MTDDTARQGLLEALEFSAKWLEDHAPWSFDADENVEIAKQTGARVALLRELWMRLKAWDEKWRTAEAGEFENISALGMASADAEMTEWLRENMP